MAAVGDIGESGESGTKLGTAHYFSERAVIVLCRRQDSVNFTFSEVIVRTTYT